MPNFDIVREVKPKKTFRVASIMGTFDLETENIIEHFKGNIALPKGCKNWFFCYAKSNQKTIK